MHSALYKKGQRLAPSLQNLYIFRFTAFGYNLLIAILKAPKQHKVRLPVASRRHALYGKFCVAVLVGAF